MRRKINN